MILTYLVILFLSYAFIKYIDSISKKVKLYKPTPSSKDREVIKDKKLPFTMVLVIDTTDSYSEEEAHYFDNDDQVLLL